MKIMDSSDTGKSQTDLKRLGEEVVENEMKINLSKSKAVSFTKARVKEGIRYYFVDQFIVELRSFKCLGIIIYSDLNSADRVSCTVRTAFHFIMRVLKWEITKHSAHTALVRPILEYGAVCWEGQVRAVNWVQNRDAKFANNINESGCESSAQLRLKARICALLKEYTGDGLGKR